ncbi:MAG: glycoside hydrolase domain-containing protein [Heyndrickxia sp.]
MAKGFDCATKLTTASAKSLKAAGFDYVARYLPTTDWKALTTAEVKSIQDAGLKLISIFEKNSTKVSYFSEAQGIADAKDAYNYAKSLGQPKGSAIYFTVDYDAQTNDMAVIKQYIAGLNRTLVDYEVGIYGSYAVMVAIKGLVKYYWQTYAWSSGKVADFIHMYQNKNDTRVSGIGIDFNEIKKEPGAWNVEVKPADKPSATKPAIEKYTVVKSLSGYLTAADAKSRKNSKSTVKADTYFVFNKSHGMINVSTKAGVPGSWINPADNKVAASATSKPVYHTVVKGDTVSALAKKYGTTQANIKKWNNLNAQYLIKIGQKLRVK